MQLSWLSNSFDEEEIGQDAMAQSHCNLQFIVAAFCGYTMSVLSELVVLFLGWSVGRSAGGGAAGPAGYAAKLQPLPTAPPSPPSPFLLINSLGGTI